MISLGPLLMVREDPKSAFKLWDGNFWSFVYMRLRSKKKVTL